MDKATLHQQLSRQARVYPIPPDNRVTETTKQADGSLRCLQESGAEFTIPAEEKEMQAFVILSMIAGGF